VTRLTSEFWVHAYLTRLRLANIPAFVTAKGDATAGAVIIKQNPLNGQAVAYQRSYALDGQRVWVVLDEGADDVIEATLARQRAMDRDIWIIEVEDRDGRHLLDAPGFSD
jgi:hypothetical protein